MSKATQFAWVTAHCSSPSTYTLRVSDADLRVVDFRNLDRSCFYSFRAAQHMANAIREYAKKQPKRK